MRQKNFKQPFTFILEKRTCLFSTYAAARLFLALLVVFTLTSGPFTLQASTKNKSQDELQEDDVSSYRIKIRRLQQGISRQKDKIVETGKKERNILAEIEVLDKRLGEHQQKLSELENKVETQQKLIDREEKALNKIRDEKSVVQDHLENRIRAYYTMGDIGLLNVTFSTKTLPELLSFRDAFDVLIKYDQDVIKVYQETIKDIERIKKSLTLEKSILEQFVAQTKEEQQVVQTTKEEKQKLLTHVRTQAKLHQKAIAEMQEASDELAESIVAIKGKSVGDERGFVANKGSLPPPVNGVLVTLFKQEKTNKLGIVRKSLGIELQADDGTEIVAVSGGDVIYSGYLRGYGNTIILHHGLQYYSVTSRIEKLVAQKGTTVKREDVIGIMGETATLFDDGLYFEIRHGRESLDPLQWLDPNRLSSIQELTESAAVEH